MLDTTPRMRGLLPSDKVQDIYSRYNPAYAGTTDDCTDVLEQVAIQPRVCGDYTRKVCKRSVMTDTTPRMRGLPKRVGDMFHITRYNPAYAGTTINCSYLDYIEKIQPRVCGDYDGVDVDVMSVA